jgi:hypothetical protein
MIGPACAYTRDSEMYLWQSEYVELSRSLYLTDIPGVLYTLVNYTYFTIPSSTALNIIGTACSRIAWYDGKALLNLSNVQVYSYANNNFLSTHSLTTKKKLILSSTLQLP